MNRPPARHLTTASVLVLLALAGCSSSTKAATSGSSASATPSTSGAASASAGSTPLDAGLGSLPSFLPSSTDGAVGHGSVDNPALSYPGAPVVVTTGQGSVKISLEGPSYPAGTALGAARAQLTFTVTFSQASSPVSLAEGHFDLYDHTGAIHRLPVVQGTLPQRVQPGQSVTVKVRATVPTGHGLVRWFPAGSASAAAAWDYVAETD